MSEAERSAGEKLAPALIDGPTGQATVELPGAVVLRGSTLPIKKWAIQLNCRFDTLMRDRLPIEAPEGSR